MTRISYSRISSYTYTCPHVYYLKYVAHVETKRQSLNRIWGSALHSAVELHEAEVAAGLDPGSLANRMTRIFLEKLHESYPQLDEAIDNLSIMQAELDQLADDIGGAKPTATKRYKESTSLLDKQVWYNELQELAHDAGLDIPVKEGIIERIAKHEDVADKYLVFTLAYPFVMHRMDDGTEFPYLEHEFYATMGIHDMKGYIDAIRYDATDPDRKPIVVDYKSNAAAIEPGSLAHNYQLINYQYACAFAKDLPKATGGAGIYEFRTGLLHLQPVASADEILEWVQTCDMVLDAEAAGIFPRTRDKAKCDRCDYRDHCATTTGAFDRFPNPEDDPDDPTHHQRQPQP